MNSMNPSSFSLRRCALLEQLGDGVAVIPTAPERVRNRDTYHPYRYDSYFWYLTGFPEPEAVLVLVGGAQPRSILFCRDKDESREVWDGFRYGPKAACAAFGFDEAYPVAAFGQKLAELIANHRALWYALGHDADWDARILQAINTVRGKSRAGLRPPYEILDVRRVLDEMRLLKDGDEGELLRRAADIASAGHSRAMQACRPGMTEYELEAELTCEFRRRGANGHAYAPIVAGGANACVLHYVDNRAPLAGSALVLIDAGCEVEGYAADITRTFPVNGKFSAVQRDVYEIVLAAQAAAISAIRPGASFGDFHVAALRVLVQGMIDLKLLSGDLDGLIAREAYTPFYMHRTGHWLGLDVHDAGEYKSGEEWTTLRPGMVLTVEPGLYIRPGADVPAHLAGMGIRIEDDVQVTRDGCDVYTTAAKTIDEIETLMRRD